MVIAIAIVSAAFANTIADAVAIVAVAIIFVAGICIAPLLHDH